MTNAQYPLLEPGKLYHIYNRGNNSQAVFHSNFEVNCFLERWNRFVAPVVDTLVYNILTNHFHVVLQTREKIMNAETGELEDLTIKELTNAFSRLFTSFAMTLHAANGSNGAVFKRRFQRREIDAGEQLFRVVAYALFNALRHRLTNDPRNYRNSSFRYIGNTPPAFLALDLLYTLFGGIEELERYLQAYHRQYFVALAIS